jgi:serine/threonine-protein kinase
MSDSSGTRSSPGGPTRPLGSSRPFGIIATDPELEPGTRLGDWVIEAKIGEGGMGMVYKAVHAVIGKQAAIKVIRAALCTTSQAGERFIQEAKVVNQIGHPNIVDIFSIGRLDDGRPYFAMELLRGQNLADRIANARMPTVDALDLLLQLCDALSAAHAHGVIHRDLKPENIFVAETHQGPVAKLLDWGIAKLTEVGPPSRSMTRSGMLVGTPQYISPEQARGRAVGPATDVYSLGVIAYELFLEAPPFSADNVADLITMQLREPPPPPREVWPDIPPPLEELLETMLAKLPELRPSLDDVIAVLVVVRHQLEERTDVRRTRMATGSMAGVPVAVAHSPSSAQELTAEPATIPAPAPRDRSWRGRWIEGLVACAIAVTATIALWPKPSGTPTSPGAAAVEAPAKAVEAPPPAAIPVPVPAVVAPSAVALRVVPAGASIQIDDLPVAAEGGEVVHTLEPGRHRLRVEARGYRPHEREIEIVPGGTLQLEVELTAQRKPAKRTGHRPRAASKDLDGTIDIFE